MPPSQTQSASYSVGYGKPPRHTQFRKGQSGNPGGRPQREPIERLKALTLQEAYRAVVIMEDGRAQPVSAIQAILRSQIELAMKGNVRAQRDILAAVRNYEREDAEEAAEVAYLEGVVQQATDLSEAIEAANSAAPPVEKKMSYAEAAQRVRDLLGLNKSATESKIGVPEEEPVREEEATEPDAAAPAPSADGAQQPENGTASAAVTSPPPSAALPTAPRADARRRSPPATGRTNRRFSGRLYPKPPAWLLGRPLSSV